MPYGDEGRNDRLIPARRDAEKVNDRDLLVHGVPQPAIIRWIWVGSHEGIFDEFIASIDLLVGIALIVIPDPTAAPGHHGANAQQPGHLTWPENAPLRIHQRDA